MDSDRLVRASDLVLQKQIADRLGISPQTVANLTSARRSRGFPRPVTGKGRTGIWSWEEVEDWYRAYWPSTPEGRRAAEAACSGRMKHQLPVWRYRRA